MHFEILDRERLSLLNNICSVNELSNFYLAGGTALSLQMKLRKSFDFDFFTNLPFNENTLYSSLRVLFPDKIEVLDLNRGTCNLVINDIQVSFFEYPYPLIKNAIDCDEIRNLFLASIEDIAVMKMSAIGGRGARKDFFDLYYIFTMTDLSSSQLLDYLRQKYGENFDFAYMLMGLDYFEDAEAETLPELFVKFDWNKAKRYFVQKKRELMDIAYSRLSL